MTEQKNEAILTPYGVVEISSGSAGVLCSHPKTGKPVMPTVTIWMHRPTGYVLAMSVAMPGEISPPAELSDGATACHPVVAWLVANRHLNLKQSGARHE